MEAVKEVEGEEEGVGRGRGMGKARVGGRKSSAGNILRWVRKNIPGNGKYPLCLPGRLYLYKYLKTDNISWDWNVDQANQLRFLGIIRSIISKEKS